MSGIARLLVNPLLLINLGGEMVFILSQRLVAQKVDSVKATQVLNDILRSLFSQQLFNELLKPQKVMSLNFFRSLITKIVHCSIMKLNEVSMSKLVDLMLMGLKAQLINCMHPAEIYDVSQNHFNGILNIVNSGPAVEYLVQVQRKFEEVYSKMTPFDFIQIKIELMQFLQDIKQKVYVFIEDNTQNSNGDIRIVNSQLAGPYVGLPGLVVTYDPEGQVVNKAQKQLVCTQMYKQNNSTSFVNNKSEWGENMYVPNRKKRELTVLSHSAITTEGSTIRKGFKNDSQMISELNLNSKVATQNLESLAALIKTNKQSGSDDVTYNIFAKPTHNISAVKDAIDFNEDLFAEIVTIDTNSKGGKQTMDKQIADMFGDLDGSSGGGKKKASKFVEDEDEKEPDGDDLLDMMDSMQD